MGLNLPEGAEFIKAKPDEVIDHLKNLNRYTIVERPENLYIGNDGKTFSLSVCGSKKAEYPVRKSFLFKLLKWFSMPSAQIKYLDTDTLTSVLNDYLLNIRSGDVRIKIENGEALTITSSRFTDIEDLELINLIKQENIDRISRNDFMMAIDTKPKINITPYEEDSFGIGLGVFNSETGFRSFNLNLFLMRYVCTNGAYISKYLDSTNFPHYKVDYNIALGHISSSVEKIKDYKDLLNSNLSKMNSIKVNVEPFSKRLKALIDRDTLRGFLESEEQYTHYDFMNLITSYAKELNMARRIELELLAGEMITGSQFSN